MKEHDSFEGHSPTSFHRLLVRACNSPYSNQEENLIWFWYRINCWLTRSTYNRQEGKCNSHCCDPVAACAGNAGQGSEEQWIPSSVEGHSRWPAPLLPSSSTIRKQDKQGIVCFIIFTAYYFWAGKQSGHKLSRIPIQISQAWSKHCQAYTFIKGIHHL